MAKFTIDTKKSIYDPIVIEIDGIDFLVRKITHEVFQKIGEYDKQALGGSPDAAFDRLIYLLGEKSKTKVKKLELREVNAITSFIMKECFSPKLKGTTEEKKVKSPGEKESP